MSNIKLINASCVEQEVDAIVNAANRHLLSGGGICGAIYKKAGYIELNEACSKIKTPLKDGETVITSAFNITNAKYIIHTVGPDFSDTANAFDKLFDAYYNSLKVLMENDLHTIAFPLISSGIFSGNLENPVATSTEQCVNAYNQFITDYKEYNIDVLLCAYTIQEKTEAEKVYKNYNN